MEAATLDPITGLPKTVAQHVQEVTGKSPRRVNLLDNAVCCRIKFGKLGTSRKVNNAEVELTFSSPASYASDVPILTGIGAEEGKQADKSLIRITKKILESPEGKAIDKFYTNLRKWRDERVVPSFVDDGLFFVSLAVVDKFEKKFLQAQGELRDLVEALCEALPEIIERDRQRLPPGAFRESDYPSVEKVRDSYTIEWSYLALQAPRSVQAVSPELYSKAQEQINQEVAMATDAIRLALVEETKKLIDWAVDRLSPTDEGKKKRFRTKTKDGEDTGFTKRLAEFFEVFNGKNITNSAQLQTLVEKAKLVMAGVDGAELAKSQEARNSVRTGFEEIQKELAVMIEETPTRMIEVE